MEVITFHKNKWLYAEAHHISHFAHCLSMSSHLEFHLSLYSLLIVYFARLPKISVHSSPINLMIHTYMFINDFLLFCRLYQVRCSLKVSPGKLPIQIETCIPDQSAQNLQTGPCVINNAGASKVFQILYRNEEVALRDVIMFRAHLLGKIEY